MWQYPEDEQDIEDELELEEELEEWSMDAEAARSRLRDYYGTAMQAFPMAVMDLNSVETMSNDEAIRAARKAGLI